LNVQIDLSKIDFIVAAGGSGGTAAGMLVGAAMNNLKTKIYTVNVAYTEERLRKKVINLAEGCVLDYKLNCKINPDNLVILDGYSKEGYKKVTPAKIKLIRKFAEATGILFDPAYTGKAFAAYYENFILKDKTVKSIFVHTGGIFGIFNRTKDYLIK